MKNFSHPWAPGDNPKVLIADDEPAILDCLKDLAENLGFGVFTATDGSQALRLYKIMQPDLVVLDMYMPRMNGLAVMANIRGISPECPIILITGFLPYERLIQISSGMGPDACIVKPIHVAKMANLMLRLMENRTPALA